ncbi:MAG: hypothetical protein GWN82_11845 [Gemmatimonadetes bacterium]|nr:hypothetical protein [Thermoplasmata archaeon]NIU31379.1 hypothetical protein [Gemmatimonadota bacterium]NIW64445.1 hypothetical protein [Gemmatimonadota bacterium]
MVQHLLAAVVVEVEQVRWVIERGWGVEATPQTLGGGAQLPAPVGLSDRDPAHLVVVADVADERQPLVGAGSGDAAADEVVGPVLARPGLGLHANDGAHDLLCVGKGGGDGCRLRDDLGEDGQRGSWRGLSDDGGAGSHRGAG